MGDDGRRDTSTPPGRPKTLRRGVLSSWIRFVRQYPLQALRRPYRRLPCRWRRDAAQGRTRHCPSPPPGYPEGRHTGPGSWTDFPVLPRSRMDQTARLRQETPRGSSPGMPTAATAKRRPRIRPRTPTKKSEHPVGQIGPWPDSGRFFGRWLLETPESGRKRG